MHGLVNKAIQSFVCDTYGLRAWETLTERGDITPRSFEAMLVYDDAITHAVLNSVTQHLGKSREMLLEDVGTYLVSHPGVTGPRRLLRFSGGTIEEFLHSLEDLPDRVRLAVPELELPQLRLIDAGDGWFRLGTGLLFEGYSHVLIGVLRAMSDEYGALTTIDHCGVENGCATIKIGIHAKQFSEGRNFSLGTAVS